MQLDQLDRRVFTTLLGGAVAAWPLTASAQQASKLPTIGFLGTATPSSQPRTATPSSQPHWVAAFVQRLRELGWVEGRTVAIEYRWAEARTTVGDPVGNKLVASLAQPGGNVTGLSNQSTDLAAKRIELLREVVPSLGRLAIMINVGNPASVLEIGEIKAAARTFGLEILAVEIRRAQDIPSAFEALKSRAEALYVALDPLLAANRIHINTLAVGARLPTMHGHRDYVEAGGLMSYGPNLTDQFRRAADYVDKILRGTKPGDLPVEQPIKFDLVINLIVAKALGLEVPPTLLARADEVIE
jgi:ABC-type uncharacterized transport system substrate-binding protein